MSRDYIFLGAVFLGTIILTWWSSDHIFFWDTVQFAGKHGSWYYENGLLSGLLPEHLDSGHPPAFGIYIAGLWTVFGRSLAVAHWGMLPFLVLNVWFGYRLGRVLLGDRYWLFVVGLLLCPFYLGHSILVSPDLVLTSGLLMGLYGIMAKRKIPLFIGSIILALISVRGNVVLGVLMLYQLLFSNAYEDNINFARMKSLRLYAPALIICIGYQIWHYLSLSWVGYHDASPWSPSFDMVSLKGLLYNSGLYVWRLMDHGMIIIYVGIGMGLSHARSFRNRLWPLVGMLIIALGLVTVPFAGLVNHRYYLPIQVVAILLSLKLLSGKDIFLSMMIVIMMALGNLIIYPDDIAQGWDSTAAHWTFYDLEQEMHDYIEKEVNVDVQDVGTAFPIWADRRFLNLDQNGSTYKKMNFNEDKYILYSNIMNDFSDKELKALRRWTIVHAVRKRGIHITLYGR